MTQTTYIPGAEPFFFPGNRVGCLLLHGFTGTPNEMRELGTRLNAHGYTVLGPALAGHATHINDLIPLTWDDWYRTATEAYDQLAQDCDAIFVIGLSLGGALSLHLAAHRAVTGVVAVAAPASINNWRILPFKLLPPLFWLFPLVKKKINHTELDDHHIRYMAYPTAATASMIRDFFPHLMNDLRDVRAPVLLIQSRSDRVVPGDSMPTLYANLGSREKTMEWLQLGGHQALEDLDKETAFEHIARFVERYIPDTFNAPSESRPNIVAEPAAN